MTPGLRRLVALAATFAPERAGRLLALVSDASAAASEAAALARRPRHERLAALSEALAGTATSVTRGEGPRHELMRRIAREARAADRTEVREGDHPRPACAAGSTKIRGRRLA